MKQIICPVSNEKINELITRLNASAGILLVVASFAFGSSFFLVFLLADFFIRAFLKSNYSPVTFLSHKLINTFKLGEKQIDKAPKIFAARMGFVMILALSVLFITGANAAALIVAGFFVFFAMLEAVFAVCVGCLIYSYFVLPFYK